MKKILFINPSLKNDVLENVKALRLPPLSVLYLATATPDTYQAVIIDEQVEHLDFSPDVDLVAITAMTSKAPRAYEIAGKYRAMGIPVIIGGIHSSMLPGEAAAHTDCVVTGEAEDIWPRILQDYEAGCLKKRYDAGIPSLETLPLPRKKLLASKYFVHAIQTSRGCPFDCHFCSVTRFNGKTQRFRSTDTVVEEVRQIRENRFFFLDDNIIGSGKRCTMRAMELFQQLKGLKKQWASQICISIVEDDALLQAAAASGAKLFFIGFESLDKQALAAMNKKINLRPLTNKYREAVKKIHDQGIAVIGSFMFGNDADSKDVFKRTADFVFETEIDGTQFSVQTPFPGTRLYQQMQEEGRLLYTDYPGDWKKYNVYDVVFKPKNMSPQELQEGHLAALKAVSSFRPALGRAIKSFTKTGSLLSTATTFFWNYDAYKSSSRNFRAADKTGV